MRVSNRDSSKGRRFDRSHLDMIGPYLENTTLGTEMTRYDVTRRSDGAGVELSYWRSSWNGVGREDCMVRTLNGWTRDRYEDCLFYAYRRTWEDGEPKDVRDCTHWEMCWFTQDHPDILSTTWPGNLFSIPNEDLESLFILVLEQVDAGIERIERSRGELEGLPA